MKVKWKLDDFFIYYMSMNVTQYAATFGAKIFQAIFSPATYRPDLYFWHQFLERSPALCNTEVSGFLTHWKPLAFLSAAILCSGQSQTECGCVDFPMARFLQHSPVLHGQLVPARVSLACLHDPVCGGRGGGQLPALANACTGATLPGKAQRWRCSQGNNSLLAQIKEWDV